MKIYSQNLMFSLPEPLDDAYATCLNVEKW